MGDSDQGQESSLDLLIFKYRGIQGPKAQTQSAQVQASADQAAQASAPAAQQGVESVPVQKPTAQRPAAKVSEAAAPKTVEGFCINHPWRRAYATCDVCKLPYCYAEVMEHNGNFYCLSDIDAVMAKEEVIPQLRQSSGVNMFSIVASLLLLVNSAVVATFTYPQIEFVASTALKTGITKFILNINPLYYTSIGNALMIVLGLIAAIGVTRKSNVLFVIAFTMVFASLLLIVYEYLTTSLYYFLPSGMLLVLIVMFSAYSRMSAFSQSLEETGMTPMNWPKPETF